MNGFFKELRRRNVFRVAGVYGVAGWLLAQVAATLENALTLPGWFDTVVVTFLLIGLPVVVIFAWAFEMTPDGVKPTQNVDPNASISRETGRKLDLAIVGAVGLLIVFIVGDRLLPGGNPAAEAAASTEGGAAAHERSIAVLPFVDMSPEGDQEYFSDGIAEELLNVLAQVPELQVAGRTSAFAFKGKDQDLREIGEILDVAHILEGSVRKAGDTVRVTAQLIRVDNGFHLWSDTYDRKLDDIFAVQDEIAGAILKELTPQLLRGGAAKPVAEVPRADLSAYELYLAARQIFAAGEYEDYIQASATFDRALEIDPDYVPALAWRAYCEMMMSDGDGAWGDVPIEEAMPRAEKWIDRALALDPNSPDALFAKAGVYGFAGDAENAERYYRRALEEKPNFPLARNDLAYFLNRELRIEEAREQLELALAHNPAQVDANVNIIALYQTLGETEKARAAIERWGRISPESKTQKSTEASFAYQLGRMAEGMRVVEALDKASPGTPRYQFMVARGWLDLGDYEKVIANGPEPMHPAALYGLGRTEEALSLSRKQVSARPDYPLQQQAHIRALYAAQQWPELVAYYDQRWGRFSAFNGAFEFPQLILIAAAMRETGHADANRFMAEARALIERQRGLGFGSADFRLRDATLLVLEGNEEEAMSRLESAYNSGWRDSLIALDPVLSRLAGRPRYEAFLGKVSESINVERAKLDLGPIELRRAA